MGESKPDTLHRILDMWFQPIRIRAEVASASLQKLIVDYSKLNVSCQIITKILLEDWRHTFAGPLERFLFK